MGFKDGTANPDPDDTALMDQLVWVGATRASRRGPSAGATWSCALIRMFVERWDRTALLEQEKIIGRTKRTGAPLGADREEDLPDYDGDPDGARSRSMRTSAWRTRGRRHGTQPDLPARVLLQPWLR